MTALHASELSAAELDQFHDQGYVRLGHVASHEEIDALCQRIDQIMLGGSALRQHAHAAMPFGWQSRTFAADQGVKGSSLKYRKIQDLEQDSLFLDYIQNPLFRDLTAKIVSAEVSIFRAMFFNKPAEQGVLINWHQDGAGGWQLSIPPKVTVWTALDDTCVATAACRSSQLAPHMIPRTGDQLSEDERALHAPDEKRLYLEMEKGEVVLLHNWTLHRSETNSTIARAARSASATLTRIPAKDLGLRLSPLFPTYEPITDN